MQTGYVYIVHGKGTKYVKVGKTTNLMRRLKTISQGVPFPVLLLSAELVHDMDKAEQAAKARFQHFHTRGEWFELPDDLLAGWPIMFTPIVEPQHMPAKVQQPPRPTLAERVLALCNEDKPLSARDIQRRVHRVTNQAIYDALQPLMESGVIERKQEGKRHVFLHVVPSLDKDVS